MAVIPLTFYTELSRVKTACAGVHCTTFHMKHMFHVSNKIYSKYIQNKHSFMLEFIHTFHKAVKHNAPYFHLLSLLHRTVLATHLLKSVAKSLLHPIDGKKYKNNVLQITTSGPFHKTKFSLRHTSDFHFPEALLHIA